MSYDYRSSLQSLIGYTYAPWMSGAIVSAAQYSDAALILGIRAQLSNFYDHTASITNPQSTLIDIFENHYRMLVAAKAGGWVVLKGCYYQLVMGCANVIEHLVAEYTTSPTFVLAHPTAYYTALVAEMRAFAEAMS